MVKIVLMSDEVKPNEKPYTWFEMGFFTHWDSSGKRRVLCIDTPDRFRTALVDLLHSKLAPNDPFVLLKPLIDELVVLSDRSVWRVSHAVREVEKVFPSIFTPSPSST